MRAGVLLRSRSPAALTVLVGGLALLTAAVIGNPKLTVAAIAAVLFGVVAIAHLRTAVLVAAVVAPFTNILGSWLGFGAGPVGGVLRDVAVFVLVFLWAMSLVRERRAVAFSVGRLLVVAFMGLVVLLALLSEDRVTALYGARNLAFYMTLLFVGADLFAGDVPKDRAIRAVVSALTVLSLLAIAEVATNGRALTWIGFDPAYGGQGLTRQETIDTFVGTRRATAGVGNALDYGWLAMFGFLLALSWRPEASRRDVWLRRLALAATAIGAVLSLTRSAWLGIAGGLIVMLIVARARQALTALIVGGILVGGVLLVYPEALFLDRLLVRDVSSQQTTSERLVIYDYAQRFAVINPLGVGIGSQGSANKNIADPRRFTLDSYYLQLVGEGGVLLLVAYLATMGALALELRSRLRNGTAGSRSLATGMIGVVAGVMLANATSGSMDSRIISIEFWFLTGVALAPASGGASSPKRSDDA